MYDLWWRVNCSTPLISYELEFREMPHGNWLSLNVPGTEEEDADGPFLFQTRLTFICSRTDRGHTLHRRANKKRNLLCGHRL